MQYHVEVVTQLYVRSQRAGADGDAKCAELKLALNNCAAAAVSLRVDVHWIHTMYYWCLHC